MSKHYPTLSAFVREHKSFNDREAGRLGIILPPPPTPLQQAAELLQRAHTRLELARHLASEKSLTQATSLVVEAITLLHTYNK